MEFKSDNRGGCAVACEGDEREEEKRNMTIDEKWGCCEVTLR